MALFLRPRRFGKSFSTRARYACYDTAFKREFASSFKSKRHLDRLSPNSPRQLLLLPDDVDFPRSKALLGSLKVKRASALSCSGR